MATVTERVLGPGLVDSGGPVVVTETETPAGRRYRMEVGDRTTGLATGRFSAPTPGVRWTAEAFADDVEFLGFAFTQFALPVTAGPDLDFRFQRTDELRSPRAVSPLLARSAAGVVLVAPLDHVHEQIVGVRGDGLTWGWHGDLDAVPVGFATTVGVYEGASPAEVLGRWAADLAAARVDDVARVRDNPLSTHLSYWTDNGAAYWYRTEPGRTLAESVADAVDGLRRDDVPVRAVELDSWFYPHEVLRPIVDVGYPEHVPPTGASAWTPRADAFPPGSDHDDRDPIEVFGARLGDPPLVLHARHIASSSPYLTEPGAGEWWVDGAVAHPADPAFFRRWFDDAARWGACCIEQDWMLASWFGVRELRSTAGRAAAWQRALNDHARSTGVDLVWCMATPADLMLAAELDRVIAVRTCDDYRYADDPAHLWTWFLTVNRLTNELGLPAFKDCFFSRPGDPGPAGIDGDPHAEVESVLAALSAGPAGIGDRVGHTDRAVVMRLCDDDGRLRHTDRAIAMIDRCLFGAPERGDALAWATATATDDDGRVWTYVLAINVADERRTIADRFELAADGGRDASAVATYDWRTGSFTSATAIEVELEPRDWALLVVCPLVDGEPLIGDPSKYVTTPATSPFS